MFKIFQEAKPIKWIYNQRSTIDFSPTYQRRGRLWKKSQKQLLIDSILNELDIPKFYFQFMPPVINNTHYNYAIIDGKQRIETILGFIDNEFPLSDQFVFWIVVSLSNLETYRENIFRSGKSSTRSHCSILAV